MKTPEKNFFVSKDKKRKTIRITCRHPFDSYWYTMLDYKLAREMAEAILTELKKK